MGQITEEIFFDAQNVARNLIDIIVGEAMKAINQRTEPHFDSFENLKIQNFGDEEILVCVKPEGMNLEEIKGQDNEDQAGMSDICYQNLQEVCIHSSTLSTQGEGDFQHPYVREAKAFYHFGAEGVCPSDQACIDSPNSSVHTSFTDELITQLHSDINNISFDNIHLSDSEVEKDLETKKSDYDEESVDVLLFSEEGEEIKMQENGCCKTNNINNFEEDIETSNVQDNHELRHSPKFSQINNLLNQYFQLKENCDERENEEEQEILSTSSEEMGSAKSKQINYIDTNPFRNPFLCSNVHSTIALSSNSCEKLETTDDSRRLTNSPDVEGTTENNEWVEANEVQIRITEPGCSKDFVQVEDLENDVDVVQTKQFWSNVGLITEHNVDRRYLGAVEIPGIESIKGVKRVEERYMTREPEEIIWVTEAEAEAEERAEAGAEVSTEEEAEVSAEAGEEALEENAPAISSQEHPKDDKTNYLSLPNKAEGGKKKNRFVSRLTKTISSIFKFNNKDSEE